MFQRWYKIAKIALSEVPNIELSRTTLEGIR